jgi:hypothetical protein
VIGLPNARVSPVAASNAYPKSVELAQAIIAALR